GQLVQNGRVFQGRNILRNGLVLGNDPQQSAHDLAGPCLGQVFANSNFTRLGNRPDLLADPVTKLPCNCRSFFAFRYRTLEHNEGNHGFTCRGIRAPHDSSLRYQLMRDQGRFDLHGSQAVARHVQHVVDAAHDPDIAIFVALGTVPRKVIALGFRWEVALLESFGVAPDRPDHGWPGFLDHQGTPLSGRYFLAILV